MNWACPICPTDIAWPRRPACVKSRPSMSNSVFRRLAWGALLFNWAVIVWGAFVRASGSGAGCGSHWPLCNGQVIPHSPQIQTVIEFTHRAMSGVALLAVIGLGGWSVLIFPPGHRVRKATIYAMVFFAAEALLGAGLVLLQLVAQDASV